MALRIKKYTQYPKFMHNTPFFKKPIRLSLLIRVGGFSVQSILIFEFYALGKRGNIHWIKELLMSLTLIRKPFVMQSLAIIVATLMMNTAHATSEQEQDRKSVV